MMLVIGLAPALLGLGSLVLRDIKVLDVDGVHPKQDLYVSNYM